MLKKLLFSISILALFNFFSVFGQEWDHQLDIGHASSFQNKEILHKLLLDYHFESYAIFPIHIILAPYWHQYYTGKYDTGLSVGIRNIEIEVVYGGNLFYDYSNQSQYGLSQVGSGWELLFSNLQFRLNTYHPVYDPLVDKKNLLIILPDHFMELESKYIYKDAFISITPLFDFNRHKWGASSTLGYNYSFYSILLKCGYDTRRHWNAKIGINLFSFPNHKFKLLKIERNKGVNYEKVVFKAARKVSNLAPRVPSETASVISTPMQSTPPIYSDPIVEVVDENVTQLQPPSEPLGPPEPPPEDEVPWWNFWSGWFDFDTGAPTSQDSPAIDVPDAGIGPDAGDVIVPAYIDAGADVDVFGAPIQDNGYDFDIQGTPSPSHSNGKNGNGSSHHESDSDWSQISQDGEWDDD